MQKAHNAPRCGAYARTTGKTCKSPAMANGRCRMHGGKSTGRPEIHGLYSKEAKAEKRVWLEELQLLKELLDEIS
jgi:hypothetical protein